VPRRFGRLWRSGARRAEVGELPDREFRAGQDKLEIGRRIEEARRRLRETIPPPQGQSRPQDPQT
jgi:hypothetical protein